MRAQIEVASLLPPGKLPPSRRWFVEGFDGAEVDVPMVARVPGDGRQVYRKTLGVGWIQAVATAIAAGSAVIFVHPPHWRVREHFKQIGPAVACHEHHGALVSVGSPIPITRIIRHRAVRVCPVTVDVAEPRHVRRFPFERLLDSAAPHVVSRNVETQSRIFFLCHGNVAGRIYEVRVYAGVARAPDSSCPPRERAAPAVPGVPCFGGVHGGGNGGR